jgi:hypothetical protein
MHLTAVFPVNNENRSISRIGQLLEKVITL